MPHWLSSAAGAGRMTKMRGPHRVMRLNCESMVGFEPIGTTTSGACALPPMALNSWTVEAASTVLDDDAVHPRGLSLNAPILRSQLTKFEI